MGLVFLPLSLLSSVALDESPSSVLVYPNLEVSLLDLRDSSSYSKCLMASLDLLKLFSILFSLLKSLCSCSFCILLEKLGKS